MGNSNTIRLIEAIGKYIVIAVYIGCLTLFIAFQYNLITVGLDGDNWIAASTTIRYTYSSVIDDHAIRSGIGAQGSGAIYQLHPSYSFTTLNGKIYDGRTYSTFGFEKTIRKASTEAELQKYLVENSVIYYNPKDPRQSAVLKPYFNWAFSLQFAFLTLLLVVLNIHLIFDEIKEHKKHKEKKEKERKEKHVPFPYFERGEDGEEMGSEKNWVNMGLITIDFISFFWKIGTGGLDAEMLYKVQPCIIKTEMH